jgi:hypothetical protein
MNACILILSLRALVCQNTCLSEHLSIRTFFSVRTRFHQYTLQPEGLSVELFVVWYAGYKAYKADRLKKQTDLQGRQAYKADRFTRQTDLKGRQA